MKARVCIYTHCVYQLVCQYHFLSIESYPIRCIHPCNADYTVILILVTNAVKYCNQISTSRRDRQGLSARCAVAFTVRPHRFKKKNRLVSACGETTQHPRHQFLVHSNLTNQNYTLPPKTPTPFFFSHDEPVSVPHARDQPRSPTEPAQYVCTAGWPPAIAGRWAPHGRRTTHGLPRAVPTPTQPSGPASGKESISLSPSRGLPPSIPRRPHPVGRGPDSGRRPTCCPLPLPSPAAVAARHRRGTRAYAPPFKNAARPAGLERPHRNHPI